MTDFLSSPGLSPNIFSHLQENVLSEAHMLPLPTCFDSLFSFPFEINFWGYKTDKIAKMCSLNI